MFARTLLFVPALDVTLDYTFSFNYVSSFSLFRCKEILLIQRIMNQSDDVVKQLGIEVNMSLTTN